MDEYLVGVYYFSGWWKNQPNKYNVTGSDWRTEFPERVATLGEYNDQATMNREIAAAASHGVDFFQILWYYMPPDNKYEPDAFRLNSGIEQFMASPNNHMMKFTMEITNHPPFDIPDDKWEAECREWCGIMKHPSYLRVGGRPVIKIHGVDFFYHQNGDDMSRVAEKIDTLRRIAKESGLPNPLIGGGVGAGGVAKGSFVAPYDFLTTYMEVPNLPQKTELYPYEDLLKYAEDGWKRYGREADKPYVPYVPAGWDPRPWKDPRPSFAMPDSAEWTKSLIRVKNTLDEFSNLGFPTEKGTQKAILIYAWNEFGEGGFIAPTKGQGEMRLDTIKKVFSEHSSVKH